MVDLDGERSHDQLTSLAGSYYGMKEYCKLGLLDTLQVKKQNLRECKYLVQGHKPVRGRTGISS